MGDYAVDNSWWYGRCDSLHGIFPVEWVRRLMPESSILETSETTREQHNAKFCAPEYTKDSSFSTIPNIRHPAMNSVLEESEIARPNGRALYDFKSGVPGELQFSTGDHIILLRYVDENWLEGELPDGRHGIFPEAYVEIIQPIDNSADTNHNPVNIGSSDQVETFPPDTYAIVLVEYVPTSPEEPSFLVGDTVTVLSRRGYSWVEAMNDYGNVGFCPAGNLKIIGSEPDEAKFLSNMDDLSFHSADSADSEERSTNSSSPVYSTLDLPVNRTDGSFYSPAAQNDRSLEQTTREDQKETLTRDWRAKRQKIIHEITETEKDYLESLQITVTVLRQDPPPVRALKSLASSHYIERTTSI